MGTFVIEGGRSLHGEVAIPGAKNAATPILAATLLTRGECVIHRVPSITDVAKMLELLRALGAEVSREGSTVRVKASEVTLTNLPFNLVKGMRSSVLLLGPLLARLKEVELPEPGGCIIGNRPLDSHLYGLAQLGAEVRQTSQGYRLAVSELKPGRVVLPEFSVTATENVLMAAALTPGTTVIELAAAEPHVQDLGRFLQAMGAKIRGLGTHRLEIVGSRLHGAEYTLMPDQIEIGTWAAAAAVTRGRLKLSPVVPEHLDIILLKLREIGVDINLVGEELTVSGSRPLKSFKLQALPYPGFPTDLQAPFAVLATQAQGTSLIHDPLYEGRLNHVSELVKMGANAVVADPHRVVITGPTPLYGREIRSFDLRAGATLIMAGLVAQGETVISDIEVVDRGYEKIDERLRAVGAAIRRLA
ncbi:MAG: UDP-N-acetylglucosamine 1-carboxyvinyltransferase [Candidatus Kerfeldbacteria bacterium]|nr:UDP-N-acetylglucosamine 1-carboxyvinyltransferase [Candidatus Kerfeldbacteria bacterium]